MSRPSKSKWRKIVVDERTLQWRVWRHGEGITIKCPQGCEHNYCVYGDSTWRPSDVRWYIENKLWEYDHKKI